jgi:hypothetical protein
MNTECKSDTVALNGKEYPCTVSLTMDLIGGNGRQSFSIT